MTTTQRPMIATFAALALFMAMIAIAPPARAAVTCGDTVTTDVVLDADLVCSGTHGIVIGADGIAIDLNGFTIRNTGGGIVHGVSAVGHADIKVANGTIRGFYHNVHIEKAVNAQAVDLVLRGGGGTGLLFSDATDSSASNIDVRSAPDAGVDVAHSLRVTLDGITARGAGWGVFVVNSVGTLLSNSDLRRNHFGAYVYLGNGNTVRDTIAKNNLNGGLANEAGTKTNFINVNVRNNPTGILFIEGGDGSAVLDSTVNRNGVGIQLGKDIGPVGFPTPSDARDVRVQRTTVRNNDAAGIAVDQAGTYSQGHNITHNRIVGNGLNPGSHVNSVGQLLDDGINVVAPTGEVEIGDNRADSNGDYGIFALGQTDLGGNSAVGNGNPAQCAGVSC